jgi:hypothetical protein
MLFDGQEMVIAGMHSRSQGQNSDRLLPVPDSVLWFNVAVSIDTIRAYLDSIGRPAITAPAQPVAVQPQVMKPGDVEAAGPAEVEL